MHPTCHDRARDSGPISATDGRRRERGRTPRRTKPFSWKPSPTRSEGGGRGHERCSFGRGREKALMSFVVPFAMPFAMPFVAFLQRVALLGAVVAALTGASV